MAWCISMAPTICFTSIIPVLLFGDRCIGGMPPVKIYFTGNINQLLFTLIVWVTFFLEVLLLIIRILPALVRMEKYHWSPSSHTMIQKEKRTEESTTKIKVLPIV